MRLTIKTAPAFEVVSLDLAKSNLGIFHSLQDELIATKLKGALEYVQEFCAVQLAQAEFVLTAESFTPGPCFVPLEILPYPLGAISKVEVRATVGAEYAELAPADYRLDFFGNVPRLSPRVATALSGEADCVKVTFTAGWAKASEVPSTLTNAVLMVCHHAYENPGVVALGRLVSDLPNMEMFLSGWRVKHV